MQYEEIDKFKTMNSMRHDVALISIDCYAMTYGNTRLSMRAS